MPAPQGQFIVPSMNRRIVIQRPDLAPQFRYDFNGDLIGKPGDYPAQEGYRTVLWAGYRQRIPTMETTEQGSIHRIVGVFTVRHYAFIDLAYPDYRIEWNNAEHICLGVPVLRGGLQWGMTSDFVEFHTEIVQ